MAGGGAGGRAHEGADPIAVAVMTCSIILSSLPGLSCCALLV